MKHELPQLPYGFADLEPYIDARTVEIHYTKHHQTYCDKFNAAIAGTELENKSVEEILSNLDSIPENIKKAVINMGGGFYNHNFYWSNMMKDGGGEATGELAEAITSVYGDFAKFKEAFSASAASVFGSGWTWLVVNNGKLEIVNTANQDCVLSKGLKPIMVLDVWEHAYYLNYQNRRPEYIEKWWNTLNWKAIGDNYSNK